MIWKMPTGGEYDYYSIHVSEQMERAFRERRSEQDSRFGKNIFESENRWMGLAGECAFERFLKKAKADHTYHDEPKKKSPLDFTVRATSETFRIDVKTKAYNRYPPFSFRVDYNEAQLQDNSKVQYLVFAGYVVRNRALHVTGWCSKEEFIEVATLYRAGEMMIGPDGRPYEVHKDMRIADIGKLRRTKTLWEKLRT